MNEPESPSAKFKNLLAGKFLDVRPSNVFDLNPTADAANIPLDLLADRGFQLSGPMDEVAIANTGPEADQASMVLEKLKRRSFVTRVMPGVTHQPPYRLWNPPPFLEEQAAGLLPGRALCLACGTGREAVALAAEGWEVVAVDILPDALALGQKLEASFARLIRVPILWMQVDLRRTRDLDDHLGIPLDWMNQDLRQPLTSRLGEFDLVCQFLYWHPATVGHFRQHLKPGGLGLIEVFNDAYWSARGTDPSGKSWTAEVWQDWETLVSRETTTTRQLAVRMPDHSRNSCD